MFKFWKDASSVIIAAKISFPKDGITIAKNRLLACRMNRLNKNSVNTENMKSEGLDKSNFKILALRRSKHSYLPGSYVFPGGNVDIADSSREWLDLFDQCGMGNDLFEPITSITREYSKISIFESQKDEILKSISLRITGIRETFEECGVLLCKSKCAHSLNQPVKWASYLSGHEIQKWQKKVQENAGEFINLCRHFECYPDIWSLQEWSNWLTPNGFAKRFNTIFFLATLDQMPTAFSNDIEINELKWSTPEELLNSSSKQEIILLPPQFYELSRLFTFNDIEQLANFAAKRNCNGSELWLPVVVEACDGEVFLLPGDDMYPSAPTFTPDPRKVENSMKEYRRQSHQLHRIEYTKECNTTLIVSNIKPSENHILPWVKPVHIC